MAETATAPPDIAHKPATVDDMYHTPRDGQKYELVGGEVTVTPAGMRHEQIGVKLVLKLGRYLEDHPIGELYGSSVGFRLSEADLLSPDVSFVRTERLPGGITPDGFGDFSPDLAVEVISPGDRLTEIEEKVQLYLSHGTHLVWVINPKLQRATVYRPDGSARVLQAQDSLDGENVLPGFACPLADIV